MEAEPRELVEAVCRAVCRVEGLDPDEPMREWESEACAYRPTDPMWTRYVTEEMIAAIERIYAAGFEDAKEMAAERIAGQWTKQADLLLRCGEMTAQELRTAKAVANGIATAIRSLHPQEPSDA